MNSISKITWYLPLWSWLVLKKQRNTTLYTLCLSSHRAYFCDAYHPKPKAQEMPTEEYTCKFQIQKYYKYAKLYTMKWLQWRNDSLFAWLKNWIIKSHRNSWIWIHMLRNSSWLSLPKPRFSSFSTLQRKVIKLIIVYIQGQLNWKKKISKMLITYFKKSLTAPAYR